MTKTRAETDSTKHRLAWALIMLGALLMALGAWRGEVDGGGGIGRAEKADTGYRFVEDA